MTAPFSTRTDWDLSESSYAAAVRTARASAARSGRAICDLTLSNPTRCGFEYDADAVLAPLRKAATESYHHYHPDPCGLLCAREAVSAYYGDHAAEVDPGALVLTTSTSESYSFLFRLLCNAGDEVLVAQPSYPLFDFLATLDDVRLRTYPLFYDPGGKPAHDHGREQAWWIDFAALKRAITPRTRAILVVHPNNPTGHWTAAREREELEALCARHGLALIVDEVFLDYGLRGVPADGGPDFHADAGAKTFARGPHPVLTFVLSGLSKIAGLPQMKAAWMAVLGPATLREEALARLEVIADTFLSMSAPTQLALPGWLAGRHGMQQQILARARENLATLERISAAEPERLTVLSPAAGWSAVISLSGCSGEADCAERLVRERGVIVHPGAFYGMSQSTRAVVSLIGPAAEFAQGLRQIVTENQ